MLSLKRSLRARIALTLLLILGSMTRTGAAEPLREAFPGAIGFGRYASGWRGGEIIQVANLADSGSGSLRECAQRSAQPRVCVFNISGTIVVDRPVLVRPNVYIAGQTAPGQGIQLRLGNSAGAPLLIKNSNNVLLRFLKLRPGPSRRPSPSIDGIGIQGSKTVYLDHLSIQFATDENIGVSMGKRPTGDITIAQSIAAWGLDRANHPKGKHSKGALICSKDGPNTSCGRISIVGNLFAHNRDRNPDVSSTTLGPVEIVNNVFYNPISQFGEFYNHYGDTAISYIGNVALPGPSTRRVSRPAAIEAVSRNSRSRIEIFAADNINLDRQRSGKCSRGRRLDIVDGKAEQFLVTAPVVPLTVQPLPVTSTVENVLGSAGARMASGRFFDSLDMRVIDDVQNCRGRVINSPIEAGGWPHLPEELGPPDADKDGMPDDWESTHSGLDPKDATDAWQDLDGDGWSNLEEYLSVLAGDFVSLAHSAKDQSSSQ